MTKKITPQQYVAEFEKMAVKLEWCDLADQIIMLESVIIKKTDLTDKQLELLSLKLEVFEREKANRVFKEFDFEYFISKDYDYFDEEMYE